MAKMNSMNQVKGNPRASKESNAILFGGITLIVVFAILFFTSIDYAIPISIIVGIAVGAFFWTRKEKTVQMRV